MNPSVLSLFHPLIQKWLSEKVGAPTDVQEKAWPEIVKGKHVLMKYGYTLKEIADHLGIHYTAVSKGIKGFGEKK